ncbi:MAG: hypothetical protein DRP47_02670 [Candidatus Zixiibacteriota bacterium]|nr:MAG: hypothetical protein DRP47_02670 [candidate division Zixibacteria bacterium]
MRFLDLPDIVAWHDFAFTWESAYLNLLYNKNIHLINELQKKVLDNPFVFADNNQASSCLFIREII